MRSLEALLSRLIDYAGLFPPAGLAMEPAVANYARYLAGPRAFVLGRFVVPAARLEEFAAALSSQGIAAGPAWQLSALVGPDLPAAVASIDGFHRAVGPTGPRVSAVELPPAAAEQPAAALAALPETLEPFFEIDHRQDPTARIAALRGTRGRAKIRSGGVTADAFPSAQELARFVLACARAGVPFKATAGLHHPLRGAYRLTYEADSPTGRMHGFLNVFLAAAFADLGEAALVELLEEPAADAFTFDDEGVRWRRHRRSAHELAACRRDLALSYGSCSFTEPIEDLEELSLL